MQDQALSPTRSYRWLLAGILLCATAPVAADEQARHDAVADLGRLNGVALHCRYLDAVRRMKAAVVANAAKQRSYGLAFDEATNESFLTHARSSEPCPGGAGFDAQVDAAVKALEQVFAP